LFLVAAVVALVAAVASSDAVGQRVEIRSASQRVEDNAFHLMLRAVAARPARIGAQLWPNVK
jgi:hypothetical protein